MTAIAPAPAAPDTPAPTSRRAPEVRAHRIALGALLVGTAVLYLWDLGINRYANDFYAAAEQAGSQSWKAWFFGASDAGNAITVDKPPASLWISGLAVRVFGLNSWSILVPQALMGVASVALLYVIARRLVGPGGGLVAGAVLALTPVAALMFRFNNPDALLMLLLLGAAWATMRILDDGRLRWAVLAGGLIGLAFLTKQLQALLIVPAIGVAYLAFGPPAWKTRVVHLLAAAVAMVVGAGWWVLAVSLWPSGSRPYIGGTDNNSIIDLTLGYNGLGRLTGGESNGIGSGARAGGGGGAALFGGKTGVGRMFSEAVGGQIAWLIPAALILGAVAIALRGRAARTDPQRSVLVFGWLWLVSNAAILSLMEGIFHPYYTLALVPPIALLVAIGGTISWRARERLWVRAVLVLTVALIAWVSSVILDRTADFQSWLRWTVVALAVVAILGLIAEKFSTGPVRSRAVVVIALIVGLAGPASYAIDTAATARTGGLATAGPQASPFASFGGDRGGAAASPAAASLRRMFGGEAPPTSVTDLLARDGNKYRWVGAAVSSLVAAGYQLAVEKPVLPIGGFMGSDPYPSLAQFQQYVADGDIHYFIGGGMQRGGTASSAQIRAWVEKNYRPQVLDGVMLYDLTATPTR